MTTTTSHNPTPGAPARRLRQGVLLVVAIGLFLGFLALGTWQVQRRVWKLALIERVDQRVHTAAQAPPSPQNWGEVNAADHEYQPIALRGHWLGDKTVLTQAVTELGAGFWVITPLQQDDGTQVLVNRGFVPQDQRLQWSKAAVPTNLSTTVQGLLRMSEPGGGFLRTNDPAQQRWYSRDVTAISHALKLPHAAPFFVDAGLPGALDGIATDTTWPRSGMTVIRFHNSHLVYALTWYGLAIMVIVAGWYVARYERRLSNFARTLSDDPPSH